MADTSTNAGAGTGPVDRVRAGGRRYPLTARALTGGFQLSPSGGKLMGWNHRETTGSAGAVVELYDGTSTSGRFLATVGLGNGTSDRFWTDEKGIDVETGLFAHMVTGTADVICFFQYRDAGAG